MIPDSTDLPKEHLANSNDAATRDEPRHGIKSHQVALPEEKCIGENFHQLRNFCRDQHFVSRGRGTPSPTSTSNFRFSCSPKKSMPRRFAKHSAASGCIHPREAAANTGRGGRRERTSRTRGGRMIFLIEGADHSLHRIYFSGANSEQNILFARPKPTLSA